MFIPRTITVQTRRCRDRVNRPKHLVIKRALLSMVSRQGEGIVGALTASSWKHALLGLFSIVVTKISF